VEFMRDAFQAFVGDNPLALAGLLSPDVEWQAVEDTEPKRGLEGVLESLGGWYEVWEEIHMDLEELIDGGMDVVAVVKVRGRHVGSQSDVTQRFFQVWTVTGGRSAGFMSTGHGTRHSQPPASRSNPVRRATCCPHRSL
jgi:ketosteroid isomerase-like protein